MIQANIFWSYGIGAGFAVAAAHSLRQRWTTSSGRPGDGLLSNPYLTGVVLYCALLLTPGEAWLMWSFPGWESMYATDRALPGWLVALLMVINTMQGILGFVVTRWLVLRGRSRWAILQVMLSYFGLFFVIVHGWDGSGYRRLLSRTRADHELWTGSTAVSHLRDWLSSDLAVTLGVIGVVIVPPLVVIMARWHTWGLRTAGISAPRGPAAIGLYLVMCLVPLGLAIGASATIRLLGWLPGAIVTAAALWLVAMRSRGLAGLVARRLALPTPQRPTSQSVAS